MPASPRRLLVLYILRCRRDTHCSFSYRYGWASRVFNRRCLSLVFFSQPLPAITPTLRNPQCTTLALDCFESSALAELDLQFFTDPVDSRACADLSNSSHTQSVSFIAPSQRVPMTSLDDRCHWCQRKSAHIGHKLLRCGGCKILHYCEKKCQSSDWKHHKRVRGDQGRWNDSRLQEGLSENQRSYNAPARGLDQHVPGPRHGLLYQDQQASYTRCLGSGPFLSNG